MSLVGYDDYDDYEAYDRSDLRVLMMTMGMTADAHDDYFVCVG